MSSCRKDFDTILSNGQLEFSQDTIFFNRVFDDISSSTHRFTVKNNTNDDITIPAITLEKGNNSFYRLNVDGIDGKNFENISILAKDSIFVFAEVTVDFNQVTDPDFMYRDKILFDAGSNQQDVELEALVLDVNLIRPDRTQLADGFLYENIILGQDGDGNDITIRGTNLVGNTTWTNNKPYLVYGYVGVPENATLTIESGVQVYFHANSGIIVQNNASLVVNGTQSLTEDLENQVVFQGDRLENLYIDIAQQWGTIWLREGSKNSEFNHLTIKNATLGLLVDSNPSVVDETLNANNTQIYNTSSFGLLGRNAKITAKNLVIGNNGQSAFATQLGGTYNITHATLATYWRSSNRQDPTLFLTNALQVDESTILVSDLQANFTNCIIDGNHNLELVLDKIDGAAFNYNFKNSMLKFNDISSQFASNPLYDFNDVTVYQNPILNGNADFFNTNTADDITNLIIGDDSEANGQADNTVIGADLILQKDILGIDRTGTTDIGAYQHITFPED
jgi:hypothetical protein